jgi:hypothetical protein
MRQIIYSLIMGVILILSFVTNWYAALGIALMLLLIIMILYKIGNGIVLLEMTAILYVFTCIIMPLTGYEFYTYNNRLSSLWVKYMPVKPEIYFSYAMPAIACFCLAITLTTFKKQLPDEGKRLEVKITQVRLRLNKYKNKGLQIMLVGVVISVLAKFLPVALNYFAILFFFASFAGLLYVYFSPDFRRKKIVLLLFIIFIIWNALQSGMFTIVAYMGITIFSFFQLGKRTAIFKKVILMFVTIAFFIVLQNVKIMFRKQAWDKSYEGSKVELFGNLFIDNIQKGNALLSEDAFFPLYARTNQGYNVALVMKRIPVIRPYDNGERLLTVFASAFVPRFLWADKPEAGGIFNMKYYAGWTIRGWSTNVGPLGEAYGSFGVTGGIIYMFLLGLFLRWVYLRVFTLSDKMPLLICWLPVLFYQTTSSAETDTLQILNSIIKSAFFIWLLTKILPDWFGMVREQVLKRRTVKSSLV